MVSEKISNGGGEVQKEELRINWMNVTSVLFYNAPAVYALFTLSLTQICWQSYLWAYFVYLISGLGIAAGAHRLWSHRSYKAVFPLRFLLMVCFSASGQYSLYDWIRDHRVHHKFSDTDGDPYNAKRGFFFSHIGWLMCDKHTEMLRRARDLDMSDILADPVVIFNSKYFTVLKLLMNKIVPVIIPPLLWGESWYNSIMFCGFIRYSIFMHAALSVNSLAHLYGTKPYDKGIFPSENWFVAWLTAGEGWHNYHHAFPRDYKAAELGPTFINWTTFVINVFAALGLAYDLKTPSPEAIRRFTEGKGDGTHLKWGKKDY